METQLDWFHIGMKLELLRKAVVMPVSYQEYLKDSRAFDPLQRRVSRLHDALWRGSHGQRACNLPGYAETSTDGQPDTRESATNRFDAPNRL
jgi:hypothetical protein